MEEVYGCCGAYTGTGYWFRFRYAESIRNGTGNIRKIRGGGISRLTEENTGEQPETEAVKQTEAEGDTVKTPELKPVEEESKSKTAKPTEKKKSVKSFGNTAENGQTILDVSEGDVRITKTGATVGGVSKDDGSLNPKGYWITGTTTAYNVVVEKEVKTEITLCDVNITSDASKMECIDVSHAEVVITLNGKNELLCKAGTAGDGVPSGGEGTALAKNGMDGTLVIKCQKAGETGHQCDENCGTLIAKGQETLYHAGAIGNSYRKVQTEGEDGFCNLTIEGGNIEAKGGQHSPGIGGSCLTSFKIIFPGDSLGSDKPVSNIRITGGNVKAEGNYDCAGIGGGAWTNIDGLYITGGRVEATGGTYGPGIGAVGSTLLKNIVISGGDTTVIAKGDQTSDTPGIGVGKYNGGAIDPVFERVAASPDNGYQGYVQDGESMDNYTFMEGSPFKEETEIRVGKFYTAVYFGPFRDENTVEPLTNEQIGANNVISKTGGKGFTKEQLKQFTKVNARDKSGNPLSPEQISFVHEEQIEAVNKAKAAGKTGDYPLTFSTANHTEVKVQIFLRKGGTDTAMVDPDHPVPTIGANDFLKDTGGEGFTEEQLKLYGELKGKDKDGTTIDLEGFTIDAEQMKKLNQAKTAGQPGTFDLTYTSSEGAKVTVQVILVKYDAVAENQAPDNDEVIRGMDIVSRTGGDGFTEEQLKELSAVKAFDKDGELVEQDRIVFSEPDQMKRINEAKAAGESGNFQLTMKAPDGTEVTVQVYLRDKGKDSAKVDPDQTEPFLAANDGTHLTGGTEFSEEVLLDLCKAKAKDQGKNTVEPSIDQKQLKTLNEAKTSGKTGEYTLTFFIDDHTKAEVKMTLTGDHKVKFDSNGSYDAAATQTVKGGSQVIEPEEPKRDGYEFEGWYYIDENGKEIKWNFSDPVHQNMTLTAKWKKEPKTEPNIEKEKEKTNKKEPSSEKSTKWNYREIQKREDQLRRKKAGERSSAEASETARTGETSKAGWAFLSLLGAAGIIIGIRMKKRNL